MGDLNASDLNIDTSLFTEFQQWLHSGKAAVCVVILAIAYILWRMTSAALNAVIRYTEKDGNRNQPLRTVKQVFRALMVVMVVIVLLQVNGVNVSSLVASLGIASAVIGFAAQEVLRDIFMGLHITADNYFKVGDVIQYKEYIGVVKKLSLRTTRIEDFYTHHVVNIANRNLDIVEVLTPMLDVVIGLPYALQEDEAHEVMREITDNLPGRVKGVQQSVYKGTTEFAESSIRYMIGVTIDPHDLPQTRRDILTEIQKELHWRGIELPYAQLDVHFDREFKEEIRGNIH